MVGKKVLPLFPIVERLHELQQQPALFRVAMV